MKLKHITFTGLDERTDVNELKIIQKAFPFVEFGVLMSKNWQTNGNRYPDPESIARFTDQGLNLSAHLCGRIAREAYTGNLRPILYSHILTSRGHSSILHLMRTSLKLLKSLKNLLERRLSSNREQVL